MSSKRALLDGFCRLERNSSSVTIFFDFFWRELIGTHSSIETCKTYYMWVNDIKICDCSTTTTNVFHGLELQANCSIRILYSEAPFKRKYQVQLNLEYKTKKIVGSLRSLFGDFFHHASSNGCAHVSYGEAPEFWKVSVGFYGNGVQRFHSHPSSVACLEKARLLFNNLT